MINPLHHIRLDDATAKRIAVEVAERLKKSWREVTFKELETALPEAVQKVRYSK